MGRRGKERELEKKGSERGREVMEGKGMRSDCPHPHSFWEPTTAVVTTHIRKWFTDLFPGLPTIQFLIACSMQKRRGKAWYHLSHE